MKKHTVTLLGGLSGALRVPADVLHETVGALIEGARQATRFFVEGASTPKAKEPRPAWLDAACRVEITGLAAGSAVVVEAPALADAAPDLFGGAHRVALFAEAQRLRHRRGCPPRRPRQRAARDPIRRAGGGLGHGQFRPSGGLLVIDVEHLGPARAGDAVFESALRATARKPVDSWVPQHEASGVSAFFGTWPGDEGVLRYVAGGRDR